MQNHPLSSSDQAKLLVFTILLVPSIFLVVGIVPAIFLIFGLFMLKKNQDFSSIDTAVRNFKIYTWLAFAVFFVCTIYFGYNYLTSEYSWNYDYQFFTLLIFLVVSAFYLVVVNLFFYQPLKKHCIWVEKNGIFSTKPSESSLHGNDIELDIIKGEKLKQYSVADELTKWSKLKEAGHISEVEFAKARDKLLSK